MCCGNVYAAIFRCEINPNHHYVIKADSEEEQVLATINPETGKIDDNSQIYSSGVNNGEVIKFLNGKSQVFKMVVLKNSKIGSDWSFRAIYFDPSYNAYVHSIAIDTWKKDAPIYLYNDWEKKLLKGTCK